VKNPSKIRGFSGENPKWNLAVKIRGLKLVLASFSASGSIRVVNQTFYKIGSSAAILDPSHNFWWWGD